MAHSSRRVSAAPISIGSALALCAALFAGAADAQDAAALATRRELIAQAQQSRQAGNRNEALALAERAGRIQMSPSLRLFIAQEQYALGRMAEAYGNADLCMREAEGDNTLRNRAQVVATCRAMADELRSRIARVIVQTPSPAPRGLEVRVGGNALADALWGVPYVVSSGHLVVEAQAPGYRPFRSEIDVAAGATSDVRIALEPANTTATTRTTETPSSTESAPSEHATTPHPAGGGVPVGPIVVMGIGAVGIVLAPVFFFVLRAPAYDRANSICPNFVCPSESARAMAQPYQSTAATWNAMTWVSAGVGVAALAGGLAWFLVSRPRANPSRAFHVVPTGDGFALGMTGTF